MAERHAGNVIAPGGTALARAGTATGGGGTGTGTGVTGTGRTGTDVTVVRAGVSGAAVPGGAWQR
ncbi:hypothetical protein [Streptomyces phytohabitans]|uniref:hypothetical protein n=1 Tax=Streptomyces phytohabitans TaxID=1150371 RepID=UPI00345C2545